MPEETRNERFWRRRPVRLAQERALAANVRDANRTETERAVIAHRIEQRRFEQAKGKVRPGS